MTTHEQQQQLQGGVDETLLNIVALFSSLPAKRQGDALTRLYLTCQPQQLREAFASLRLLLLVDPVRLLPAELAERVLALLGPSDLCHVALCSRVWRERANSDVLWKRLCAARGWLHLGTDQLLVETQRSHCSATARTSPTYTDHSIRDTGRSSLVPTCHWKRVHARAAHLSANWASGRYAVERALRGHGDRVTCLDCDGEWLVSGSVDGTARVWRVATSECAHVLARHTDAVNAVRVRAGVVLTGCSDSLIRVFSAATGECTRALMGHSAAVDHLCYDGARLLSASADSATAAVWVVTKTPRVEVRLAENSSPCVRNLPKQGPLTAWPGEGRTVRVWAVKGGRCLHILRGHEDEIQALHQCGLLALSASWDCSLRLWDTERGVCQAILRGHSEAVYCCQFDVARVVSGGGDGLVVVWSTASGERLATCTGHTEEVVSGGGGRCLFTLREHVGVVLCLHLLRDRLVSGGNRKKIVVWDVKNGRLLNVVHRNPSLLHRMWVSETAVVIASPEAPGTLTLLTYW
ncbi:unnamed protein product [Lampetra fluviatilis]